MINNLIILFQTLCNIFLLVLQPGGSLFLTTLNRTFALWAFGIVFAEYIMRIVPPGTHNVNDCIMPHEVQALLEKCKFIKFNIYLNKYVSACFEASSHLTSDKSWLLL
jgi:2-polyprenyl-3-methyl-5-hydroxy-6-metoxy-1,4-benzoquinol methylase